MRLERLARVRRHALVDMGLIAHHDQGVRPLARRFSAQAGGQRQQGINLASRVGVSGAVSRCLRAVNPDGKRRRVGRIRDAIRAGRAIVPRNGYSVMRR